MPKVKYIEKNFKNTSMVVINQANTIIDDYLNQGLVLTLRQLYYRFVAADLIPNTQREYSRLGSIINDARLAGLVDWSAIEDRGRSLNNISWWDSPSSIVEAAANSYRIDKWDGQEYRVEVWVEKQALESVVIQAAEPLDVQSFACKGYTSQSEMWRAAQRLLGYTEDGQLPVIIHLGDHDPSGIDMTRDIKDRMSMFGVDLCVNRVALNMDQIEEFDPPPNPTKFTDSRAVGYISEFGNNSWELDALEPSVLISLISKTILKYCEEDLYNRRLEQERSEQEDLLNMSNEYEQRDVN